MLGLNMNGDVKKKITYNKENKHLIIYVDMVADLFHTGHVNILKTAKSFGIKLIVGIHSDISVKSYKRTPVMNIQDRIIVVEACKYVDKVVPDAPLILTNKYLNDHNIDIVVHGDDINSEMYEMMYGEVKDRMKLISYTPNISTSKIIKKRTDLD